MNCDYPEQVVLIAPQKFGEDQYEAHNWVTENASQYSMPGVEGAGAEVDEEMESESDSELEPDENVASAAATLLSPVGM